MTGKYDFILFENYHLATNHKYDVLLIAKLLQKAKLKVALLDIYHESTDDEEDGIPIIHLKNKLKIPNDKWQKHPKNKIHSLLCLLRFLIQQHFYMKQVFKEIEPLADRFYCGSYHLNMSTVFFKSKKPCYYWGLRSTRITDFFAHFKNNPISGIRMLWIRYKFIKNPAQQLFISNEIIKKEFEHLGISTNRMILREERCITKTDYPDYEKLNTPFSLLTIGMLRPDKRIEYTINEFKQCNRREWTYTLAGKSQGKYENNIIRNIGHFDSIKRINQFLDYQTFNALIKEAHFVVFADKKQKSSITNGTMLEALINYRPIIAPNYDPYRFYINKYGIGILYEPDIPHDLTRAIQEAEKKGCINFYNSISAFLKTIRFDSVSKSLYAQIYKKQQL